VVKRHDLNREQHRGQQRQSIADRQFAPVVGGESRRAVSEGKLAGEHRRSAEREQHAQNDERGRKTAMEDHGEDRREDDGQRREKTAARRGDRTEASILKDDADEERGADSEPRSPVAPGRFAHEFRSRRGEQEERRGESQRNKEHRRLKGEPGECRRFELSRRDSMLARHSQIRKLHQGKRETPEDVDGRKAEDRGALRHEKG